MGDRSKLKTKRLSKSLNQKRAPKTGSPPISLIVVFRHDTSNLSLPLMTQTVMQIVTQIAKPNCDKPNVKQHKLGYTD